MKNKDKKRDYSNQPMIDLKCFFANIIFHQYFTECFVAVPPKIHAWERTLEVTAGDDLSIICEATGNPMPRVSWRKYETGKRWHSCLGLVLDIWHYVSLVSLLTVTDYVTIHCWLWRNVQSVLLDKWTKNQYIYIN